MRSQDQEHAQQEAQAQREIDSLVADTVGAQIPRSSGSPPIRPSVVGIRPRVTLLVAGVLAVVAITAMVLLTWHANSARDAEDRLDDIVVNLNGLQDLPWRLETSAASNSPGAAVPLAALTTTERRMITRLAALAHEAPAPGLDAARGPLNENFAALARAVNVVTRGDASQVRRVAPAVFRSHDEVLAAFDRARAHYNEVADGRLWEATIGSILVLALLLVGFAVFFLRSVKARMKTEALAAELELSREHLEYAQAVAGVGSWEWDDTDRILRWSPEQARLHGWSSPNPPASPEEFLRLVAPDDRRRVSNAMHEVFMEGRPIDLEYRVAESRGGRLIHIQASTVLEADGRKRVIGTSQDMTERFRRVEAERANRAKDEFISRMSHELRTPLNAVLGFGQLMSMSDLDERQQGNVDHILSAGHHLLDLINEILDISRIESGDIRMSLEPVMLSSILADTAGLVRGVAGERDISLAVDCPNGLWVRADAQRLRQVFLNLLSNAVKYNSDGGHVAVRARRDGTGRVRIEVLDDGVGIAPEMIERLFRPFERLGAEQTDVEGTGLGLAVARGMIEAMGGRISVRSIQGVGSTFTVELPEDAAPTAVRDAAREASDWRAQTDRVAPISARTPGVGADTPAGSLTVLCIEDNDANIELVEQILAERPGVQLLAAKDARSGVQLAQDEHVDLILLDLDLPDRDGADVLGDLTGIPATADIPVVILSAADAEGEAERLLELGARSYLSKPPGVTALLGAVDGVATSQPDPQRSPA